MKYFIVADVHSHYTLMKDALNAAGFDPSNLEHIFVSLGDLFDRGDESLECLEYVMKLDPSRRIFIRGNHEDLIEDAMSRERFYPNDETNGTTKTAMQITKVYEPQVALMLLRGYRLFNAYLAECRDYFETQNAIFVHGWIPCTKRRKASMWDNVSVIYDYYDGDWRNASEQAWDDARWINGMDAWDMGVRDRKAIFCGHWHTSWGHAYIHADGREWPRSREKEEIDKINWSPFVDKGIVALDACTALSKQVNCYIWEE